MNLIAELEQEQIGAPNAERQDPRLPPGDTLRVNVKVIEGTRERVQAFEGVCIARRNRGLNSAFTVRKISYGEGVERVFPLYSPRIAGIEVVRRGRVRRAKLYYLRGRTGKSARIAERRDERAAAGADGATPAAEATGVTAAQGDRRGKSVASPAASERHGQAAHAVREDLGRTSGRRAAGRHLPPLHRPPPRP